METSNEAPSPWRTLVRFAWRGVLVLVAGGVLWMAWWGYAEHRLSAHLAGYRAAGEPASPMDLAPKGPVGDNAYEHVMAAAKAMHFTSADKELFYGTMRGSRLQLPLNAADLRGSRDLIDRHAATWEELGKARQAGRAVWPHDLARLFPAGYAISAAGPIRELAEFCRLRALVEHQEHLETDAMDRIEDMRFLSRMADQGQFLIHDLIAVAIDSLAMTALLEMAPDLNVGVSRSGAGLARRDVAALIATLANDRDRIDRLAAAFRNERVLAASSRDYFARSSSVLRPLAVLSVNRVLIETDTEIKAVSWPIADFPASKAVLSKVLAGETNLDRAMESASALVSQRVFAMVYQEMVLERIVALRLAIRLYQLDHADDLPPDLQTLVPAYLASVPVDPFRADGGPLSYSQQRRVIWSVHENGIDDGGVIPVGHAGMEYYGTDIVTRIDRITGVSSNASTATSVAPPP